MALFCWEADKWPLIFTLRFVDQGPSAPNLSSRFNLGRFEIGIGLRIVVQCFGTRHRAWSQDPGNSFPGLAELSVFLRNFLKMK
jgi:hypothetical protein